MKNSYLILALLEGKPLKRDIIRTLDGIVLGEWYIA